MRYLFHISFLILGLTHIKAQTAADLKKINKEQVSAVKDQKEIERLTIILIDRFLTQANDSTSETNRQLQDFFTEYDIGESNISKYIYPKHLRKSNLSTVVTNYDYTWGLLPSSKNLKVLEGYRDKSLDVLISVPVYGAYHRGYSINSILFSCKLTEVINWTENENNVLPIEKLPSYKKTLTLDSKVVNLSR